MHTKALRRSNERRPHHVNASTHQCSTVGAYSDLPEKRSALDEVPNRNPEASEATRSQKRILELERKLEKAERVIDIQGKVYALLRACAGESADHLDLPPWSKRSET